MPPRMSDRDRGIEELSAVGEGVRRDVEDAHHDRPAEREQPAERVGLRAGCRQRHRAALRRRRRGVESSRSPQYRIFWSSFLAASIQRPTRFSEGSSCTRLCLALASAIASREPAGIAVLQLLDGVDAGVLEQFRIGLAHALDAHAVGRDWPSAARSARRRRASAPGSLRSFADLRGFEQLFGGPDSERLQSRRHRRADARDRRERIGQATPP